MGIPKFFAWYARQKILRSTLSSKLPKDVDILAIDANTLIYRSVERHVDRELIFRGTFAEIVRLTRMVRPQRSLYIFFDGVAPMAKINQQRARRYNVRVEKGAFDTNQITPGTDFMRELDDYIRKELLSGDHDLPPHIVYSSHLDPGEGEHKIVDHLRRLSPKDDTLVVYGSDADLMMIYLLQLREGWRNIYVMRDEEPPTFVDLKSLEQVLIDLYPKVTNPTGDFVVLIFLIGNDFLPHFPVFERVPDALDALVFGYADYIKQHPKGITDEAGIVWPNLTDLLEYITTKYNADLLTRWAKNKDAMIKTQSYIVDKCMTRTTSVRGTQTRCTSRFDVEKFGQEWYRYVFAPKGAATGAPKGVVPTQEDKDKMVAKYLEGIAWVYKYYTEGAKAINHEWYYPYHYAPLFSDLHKYMRDKPPTWVKYPTHIMSPIISPYEQLVMVLPQWSAHHAPEPLRILFTYQSGVYDLMPIDYLRDAQGKMDEWQAISLLPFPSRDRVALEVEAQGLPEYIPAEPLIINRDMLKTYRARKKSYNVI